MANQACFDPFHLFLLAIVRVARPRLAVHIANICGNNAVFNDVYPTCYMNFAYVLALAPRAEVYRLYGHLCSRFGVDAEKAVELFHLSDPIHKVISDKRIIAIVLKALSEGEDGFVFTA